ncbi:MAG: hypothetical protein P8N51_16075 [Pseudomonadales bacterium]|nr:hypothetical protein [Pseudomonadales bacterium]MDG1444392.1 hypothetical protein [Pseudomonadales bacterium]
MRIAPFCPRNAEYRYFSIEMETGHANVTLLALKSGLETFQIPELTKKVI